MRSWGVSSKRANRTRRSLFRSRRNKSIDGLKENWRSSKLIRLGEGSSSCTPQDGCRVTVVISVGCCVSPHSISPFKIAARCFVTYRCISSLSEFSLRCGNNLCATQFGYAQDTSGFRPQSRLFAHGFEDSGVHRSASLRPARA
jgi:hypothetical protein